MRLFLLASVAAAVTLIPSSYLRAQSPTSAETGDARRPMEIAKKPPEMLMFLGIRDGMLSVDGMVAKVHLDYKVDGAEFLYFYVPGEGTMVVSRFKTPNSTEIRDAFNGNELAFSVSGHDIKLENGGPLTGPKTGTSAYVKLDTDAGSKALGGYPMMGYGDRPQSPYVWPAALPLAHTDEPDNAPRVPAYMLPRRTSVSVSTLPVPAAPAR